MWRGRFTKSCNGGKLTSGTHLEAISAFIVADAYAPSQKRGIDMDDYADYRIHCEFCNTQYRPKIQGGHPIEVCPNCKATKAQARMMG